MWKQQNPADECSLWSQLDAAILFCCLITTTFSGRSGFYVHSSTSARQKAAN